MLQKDILEDVIVSSTSRSERGVDLGNIFLKKSCLGRRSKDVQTSIQVISEVIEFFKTTLNNSLGEEVVVLGLGGKSAHETLNMSGSVSVCVKEVISISVSDRSGNNTTSNLSTSDVVFKVFVFTASVNNTTSNNLTPKNCYLAFHM